MKQDALIIVTPGFPTDERDTTCLPAFQQFALSLKETAATQEIIVLAFQYPFEKKNYTWHGIPVIALGGKNKGGLSRRATWLSAYRALKKLSKHYRLSGLISLWLTECALVANLFARRHKIRHLTWIIGQDAKPGNRYVNQVRPAAGQLMAMSDFLQTEFQKNYGITPAHVVENGINPAAFPEYNAGERTVDIFGAGSLIPLKNYSLFIELVAELKKIKPGITAVIAGDGEEREKLQQLVNTYGLQKNVTLAGLKTHPETLQLMSRSKVFLHTSHYEGNSTVLMEALYSGCRVISTCALSNAGSENLIVSADKQILLQALNELFLHEPVQQKQIVFNTMNRSAQRIMALLSA